MSDERERDAALIDAMRRRIESEQSNTGGFAPAALRELDRLTAERDQAREQLAKLREACEGVPEYMEYEIDDTIGGGSGSIERDWIAKQRDWIARIRAALGIESEADHE